MRRKVKRKTHIQPDRRFQSLLITQFINKIMLNGKKSVAERIVYEALDKAAGKINKTPLETLDQAIENAGPQLELRSRRIGGANYQVPFEVKGERKTTLAFRWIINASRKAKGKPMAEKLAEEIINACNNIGAAVKKKQDTHKMAEANKAFAHFAW